MRAVPTATICAVAAALLAWNVAFRTGGQAPAALQPQEPAAYSPAAALPPGPSSPEAATAGVAQREAVPATGPAPSPPRVAATAQGAAPAGPPEGRPIAVGGAVAGVRQHAAGSRAHAEAIAADIGSAQHLDAAGPVARLYLVSFDRVPDSEGYEHYIGERDRGTDLASMAGEFAGGREFDMRFGALGDAAFVDRLLANSGVVVDPVQRDSWIAGLAEGRIDRGEVMIAISENPAFQQATAHEVYVIMAFHEALARPPSPAELAGWSARLDAGYAPATMVEELLRQRRPRG